MRLLHHVAMPEVPMHIDRISWSARRRDKRRPPFRGADMDHLALRPNTAARRRLVLVVGRLGVR
jgi:hypothetical protein